MNWAACRRTAIKTRKTPVNEKNCTTMTDDPDNAFFKNLLNLVPPQVYFTQDEKEQIRIKSQKFKGGVEKIARVKKIRKTDDPLNTKSVVNLQITLNTVVSAYFASKALQQDCLNYLKLKMTVSDNINKKGSNQVLQRKDGKIKAKKEGKQKRRRKEKSAKLNVNIHELQEKLKVRIEELRAKRVGTITEEEKQEKKRLERKRKQLGTRMIKKKKKKTSNIPTSSPGNDKTEMSSHKSQNPSKPILNKAGKMVFSKFHFTETREKDSTKSTLVGKDYKRLLQKLEQRDAQIAKAREKNPQAATKLEQKHLWQDVLSKAKGEKVKDNPGLLKKALKRKEKMKEKRMKKWVDRQTTVERNKKERQEKRNKNIQKSKDTKKDHKRKKLVKKGHLLPGF